MEQVPKQLRLAILLQLLRNPMFPPIAGECRAVVSGEVASLFPRLEHAIPHVLRLSGESVLTHFICPLTAIAKTSATAATCSDLISGYIGNDSTSLDKDSVTRIERAVRTRSAYAA